MTELQRRIENAIGSAKMGIENRTGVLWGISRGWDEETWGPEPIVSLVLRPRDSGWVNIEIRAFRRLFYVTWGNR